MCESQVFAHPGFLVEHDMAWVAPQYPKDEVDAAGKILAKRNSSNPLEPFDSELLQALTGSSAQANLERVQGKVVC